MAQRVYHDAVAMIAAANGLLPLWSFFSLLSRVVSVGVLCCRHMNTTWFKMNDPKMINSRKVTPFLGDILKTCTRVL